MLAMRLFSANTLAGLMHHGSEGSVLQSGRMTSGPIHSRDSTKHHSLEEDFRHAMARPATNQVASVFASTTRSPELRSLPSQDSPTSSVHL